MTKRQSQPQRPTKVAPKIPLPQRPKKAKSEGIGSGPWVDTNEPQAPTKSALEIERRVKKGT